jgi:hypothetical protein
LTRASALCSGAFSRIQDVPSAQRYLFSNLDGVCYAELPKLGDEGDGDDYRLQLNQTKRYKIFSSFRS